MDETCSESKLEAEISSVFLNYLNHVDQECLGLSEKSITQTTADAGVAVSTLFFTPKNIIYKLYIRKRILYVGLSEYIF